MPLRIRISISRAVGEVQAGTVGQVTEENLDVHHFLSRQVGGLTGKRRFSSLAMASQARRYADRIRDMECILQLSQVGHK